MSFSLILIFVEYLIFLHKCTFTQDNNSGVNGSSLSSYLIRKLIFENTFLTNSKSVESGLKFFTYILLAILWQEFFANNHKFAYNNESYYIQDMA